MNLYRTLFFLFPLFSCALAAQPKDSAFTDEIPQGVIYVKKPQLIPYVKVDYKLYLCHIPATKREVPVTVDGYVQTDRQTIFDSAAYSKKLERFYPQKAAQLSRYYSESISYHFMPSDTPHVDTMVVGLWIDGKGRVREVIPDSIYVGEMPQELVNELVAASLKISVWGNGGGYYTPKRFLRPKKLVLENYYCEMFVIVSTAAQTKEQRKTGVAYAPFDYPLNSPPIDAEMESSLQLNSGH